jgi:phenylalanyl-tRNA synthetase beta chain
MKISENWLRERVDLSGISRQQLLDRLTGAGLEVEAAVPVAPPLPGIVVARIESAVPHPNAAKLQVCMVNAGAAELLQIVCGAPNARAGLLAPLAMVGTTMPDGKAIGAAELRGVASFGMLCSAAELGLDPDASGLLELPAELNPGQLLSDALGLDDVSIEIKLTPNRSDCLGVRGIARELSALFQRSLRENPLSAITIAANERLPIRLDAGAACPRYMGRAVVGLDCQVATPLWMRERLRRSGLKAIHPLVDITNYVLLETGQPMHAFDLDQLKGGIAVRFAHADESLELLDGRCVKLDPQFLGIADDDGLVAVAGVMGGARTKVTEHTARVFFESAHFAPAAIMGRSRKLGLSTESAHRFERGVDPDAPGLALELATQLCLQICGGVAGPINMTERAADLPRSPAVVLRHARLQRVLGIEVVAQTVSELFQRLGCQVHDVTDGWSVKPPAARFDLLIEEDLIEEVARMVGYEHIPAISPVGSLVARIPSETRVERAELSRRLVTRDFREAITMAFVDRAQAERFHPHVALAALSNPLSADLAVMRPSLLPGLCAAAVYNQRRQQSRVRLFEMGRVFLAAGAVEVDRAAAVVVGTADRAQWGVTARPVDFFDLSADLTALIGNRRTVRYIPGQQDWAHPGRCAEVIVDGQSAGWIGQLHPRVNHELDVIGDLLAFEVDLTILAQWPVPVASEISRFPSVRRDLALVLPDTVSFAAVADCLSRAAGPALGGIELFDVYRGGNLPAGSRSLAIGLIFQAHSRTLVDIEVDQLMASSVELAGSELGGSIRR